MKKFGKITVFAIYYIAGMLCGALIGKGAFVSGNFMIGLISMAIPFCLALILNIALHEAGHLIFGLLTGYKFISYRLGSFTIMRSNGKYVTGRMNVAGTGGQCLMLPPEPKDGKVPSVLYNLGGAIVNALTGFLALGISAALGWSSFWMMFAVCAFATALANGIPFHAGYIDNDGMNALSLRKNPEALEAFCLQLKVAGAQTDMLRLRDMPAEWFDMPSEDAIDSNTLVATKAVLIENRLMDEYRFDEALALAEKLCRKATVLDLHKQLLKLDIASILLLKGRSDEALQILDEKPVMKAMKLPKVFPPCLRTRYIAAKLGGRGSDVSARLEFDRICKKYPYKGDIESERELMALADSVSGGEMR